LFAEVGVGERFRVKDTAQFRPRQKWREDQIGEEALVAHAAPGGHSCSGIVTERPITTAKNVMIRALFGELRANPDFTTIAQETRHDEVLADSFLHCASE
jgi:hypothetical protein